jgi:hypothetical protein
MGDFVPSFTNERLSTTYLNGIDLELTQSHTDEYTINSITDLNSNPLSFSTSFNDSKQVITITGLDYNTQYGFIISVSYAGNDITYTTGLYFTAFGRPLYTADSFKSSTTSSIRFELTQKRLHTTPYNIISVQNDTADIDYTFTSTFTGNKSEVTVTGLSDAQPYTFLITASNPIGVRTTFTTQTYSTIVIILSNPAVSSVGSSTATFTFSQNVAEDISYVIKNELNDLISSSEIILTRNDRTVTMVVSGLTNTVPTTLSLYKTDGTTKLLEFPEITCTDLLSAPSILNTTFNDATGVLSVRFNTTFNPSTTVPPETLRVTLYDANRVSLRVLNFSVVWSADYASATITPV